MNIEDQISHRNEIEQQVKDLDSRTSERILNEVLDFLDRTDLPSAISQLTEIQMDLCNLNRDLLEYDEKAGISVKSLADHMWALTGYINLYVQLDWLRQGSKII
jgi:hypothetical protein